MHTCFGKQILINVVSTVLFWPEAVRAKVEGYAPTALTRLSAISVFKLFLIAIRKPRQGNSIQSKRAIRRIAIIQTVKLAPILVVVISFLQVIDTQSIDLFRIIVILAFIAIMVLLDWSFWDADLESSLRREIKLREAEFGLLQAERTLSRTKERPMELVPPIDVTQIDDLHRTLLKNAVDAGIPPSTYLRKRWESRAGLKASDSIDTDDEYTALKQYLES